MPVAIDAIIAQLRTSPYSAELRARIIDRWQELEAAVARDQRIASELDMKRLGGMFKNIIHKDNENLRQRLGAIESMMWRATR